MSLNEDSAVSGKLVPLVSAAPIGPWQLTQMRLGSGNFACASTFLSTWLLWAIMSGLVMAWACIELCHSATVRAWQVAHLSALSKPPRLLPETVPSGSARAGAS